MNANLFARRAFFPFALLAAYGAGRVTPDNTSAQAAASTRGAQTTIPMQRRAFRFRIRPEKAAGYKAWHRRVSPQLLRELSSAGVRNYSLHLAKDGTVFGYMESRDWNRVDREMSKSRANAPWQKKMEEYIVPAKPNEDNSLEEVFYLR